MDSPKIAMSILLEDPLGKKDRKVVPSWEIRTASFFQIQVFRNCSAGFQPVLGSNRVQSLDARLAAASRLPQGRDPALPGRGARGVFQGRNLRSNLLKNRRELAGDG